MGNKYYTPEIEEFYVGFEYEFNVGSTTWTKFIFDLDRPGKVLENFKLNPQLFRVKCLNKEDIESLFNPLDILEFKETEKGSILFSIIGNNKKYNQRSTFCYVYTKVKWLMIYDRKTEEVRFSGFIKNKSELKKLLKQLDIL